MATQAEQPKIILYWLEKSRAQRILWLLEECKLNYEVKTYKRVNRLAPPELKEIHPLGKSPLLSVQAPGQEKPIILAESAAICEYLTDYYGKNLVPARYKAGEEGKVGGETEAWTRYRFYMHYAEGSLMSFLLSRYLVSQISGPEVPFFIRPITRAIVSKMDEMYFGPNVKTHFGFLDSQLASSGGKYLTGDSLTAADILMSYPLLAATNNPDMLNVSEYKNLQQYVEHIKGLETYKLSIKKAEELTGEKYELF